MKSSNPPNLRCNAHSITAEENCRNKNGERHLEPQGEPETGYHEVSSNFRQKPDLENVNWHATGTTFLIIAACQATSRRIWKGMVWYGFLKRGPWRSWRTIISNLFLEMVPETRCIRYTCFYRKTVKTHDSFLPQRRQKKGQKMLHEPPLFQNVVHLAPKMVQNAVKQTRGKAHIFPWNLEHEIFSLVSLAWDRPLGSSAGNV